MVSLRHPSRLWRALNHAGDAGWGTRADDFDPVLVERVLTILDRAFGNDLYLPVSVSGWENLPPSPALMVSNHSGGSTIPDCWGFAWAWYRRFGTSRILHALAHEMLFATRLSGPWLARMGVLRASRERALAVLQSWRRDLWVMPGGDRETWRPWRERNRVRFGERRGYARIALESGRPVVPMVNAGAHETLMVLTDGHELARRLHLHELLRIDVFPVHLSLPWGIALGPLPHVPWPARLRYRIGPPVAFPPGHRDATIVEEDEVREYDVSVRAALQAELDRLACGSA